MTEQASAPQAAPRTWFLQGAGLAALMLLGVYSMGGLVHHDGSDESHTGPEWRAFYPAALPGTRTGGLRQVKTRIQMAGSDDPEYVANQAELKKAHQKKTKQAESTDPEYLANQEELKKLESDSFKRLEAAKNKLQTNMADAGLIAVQAAGSLGLLAKEALDSGADPSKLASVFAIMPAEDKKKVDMMASDVLAKAKSLPGVTGPLDFFDPLGFCTDCSEGKLCFYREVELKHGRVAMLASLGFLVGESFHPLFGGDIDVPSYLAFQQTPLQQFWPAVVAAIAIPEVFSVYDFQEPGTRNEFGDRERWVMKTDREIGSPSGGNFDPLGLKPEDPAELKQMQNKELNNGRLAMIGAAGMIAQELVSGEKILA